MFVLSAVKNNPITNSPALWFYSPRCSIKCQNCLVPVKSNTQYNKIDVVNELRDVRSSVDSIVFYIGDLKQKHYIISKYINVIKSRWNSIGTYLAFSFPNISILWKLLSASLVDGIILHLHWPLAIPPNNNTPPLITKTQCDYKEYMQTLFLYEALKENSVNINFKIVKLYDKSELVRKYDINWDKEFEDIFL